MCIRDSNGLKDIINVGYTDRELTSGDVIREFYKLKEVIEIDNYPCLDNKTIFIVERTYKGKQTLKDKIRDLILNNRGAI